MKAFLREYGVVTVLILLGMAGYVFYEQNKQDVLDYSLDLIGDRLLAMVDEEGAREALGDRFALFKERVINREVEPEQVEHLAVNVLNLSNSGSRLTPQEAALVLDLAVAPPAPPAAGVPPAPPVPPVDPEAMTSLGERLEGMLAMEHEVHEAMKGQAHGERQMAQHVRFRRDRDLQVVIDPALEAALRPEVLREMAEMERRGGRRIVVWERDLAHEIRREQERARRELRGVAEMQAREQVEAREALKALASLKHLEMKGFHFEMDSFALPPGGPPGLSPSDEAELRRTLEAHLKTIEQALERAEKERARAGRD